MRIGGIHLLSAVAAAVSLAPSAAQQPPSPGFQEQVSVGYVLVSVTVRSRSGFVLDLAAEEFRLTVDEVPVAVDSFERGADAPARLALLQDLSGSMGLGRKLSGSRRAVTCLIEASRAGDQLALATFAGHRLQVEVPFTPDPAPIREAMAGWRPYGVTALHDAIGRIPEIAATRAAPNAAAVLITDGVENASALDPDAAREIVRRSRIPVYVLGFTARTATADEDSELARYEGVLRRLAAYTGGGYFPLRQAEDLQPACARISLELRSRYVLGFPAGAEGEVAYRRLRVEVDRRGVRVAHRQGYTGRPPG